jgi:hypothetical protein
MRKARTVMLEQGTQTPSPAPDLIPAETKNQARTNIRIGTANGGTSFRSFVCFRQSCVVPFGTTWLRSSTLRHPVMPVANGLCGGLVDWSGLM